MNARLSALLIAALLAGFLSGSNDVPGATAESRAYRSYITSAARDGLFIPEPTGPQQSLPPRPPGWPASLGLGTSDGPGGAEQVQAEGFRFRYQYLAGGVNTGNGWRTWAPNGAFAENYVEESVEAGVIPVFSYYMVRQSEPGNSKPEREGVLANLTSDSTMRALFEDLASFFRSVANSPDPVVLHFEPDLWGFLQQQSQDDNGATVEVAVTSSQQLDVTGLPDNAAGLAQAVVALRDRYAPNVLVAFHYSTWGSGVDPVYTDLSSEQLTKLVDRSVHFYESLGARFDLAFAEMSDRDAGFKQFIYGDGGASWWDESDFSTHLELVKKFVTGSQLRVVLWQIPLGNTRMRSMDNTWNHFQDNKVEWLLGDSSFDHLRAYVNTGVIGLLFGRGADGATCACDASNDGVTNPAPINGNSMVTASSDDDGGYFALRAAIFAAADPLPIP